MFTHVHIGLSFPNSSNGSSSSSVGDADLITTEVVSSFLAVDSFHLRI